MADEMKSQEYIQAKRTFGEFLEQDVRRCVPGGRDGAKRARDAVRVCLCAATFLTRVSPPLP